MRRRGKGGKNKLMIKVLKSIKADMEKRNVRRVTMESGAIIRKNYREREAEERMDVKI